MNYPIEDYSKENLSGSFMDERGYIFPKFKNKSGESVIFKQFGADRFWALSEVFHSRLGTSLIGEHLTVKNNLSRKRNLEKSVKIRGISSKIFTAEDEQIISMLHHIEVGNIFTVELAEVMKTFSNQPKKIRDDFIRIYLAQNFFGNIDQSRCHNMGYITKKNSGMQKDSAEILRIAPAFDLAASFFFVDYPKDYEIYNSCISEDNMRYLITNYKSVLDDFLCGISPLRTSDAFKDLCDFSSLTKYYGHRSSKKLAKLNDRVYNGYKERVDVYLNGYRQVASPVLQVPLLMQQHG